MYWLVLVTVTYFVVALIVFITALIARIPAREFRSLFQIAEICLPCLALVVFGAYLLLGNDVEKSVYGPFAQLPRYYIFLTTVFSSVSVAMFVIGILGLTSKRELPEIPRASTWRLGKSLRRLLIAGFAAMLVLVAQDFELRWRFERYEREAKQLAESVSPSPAKSDTNAWTHYRHVVDASAALESIRESRDDESRAGDSSTEAAHAFFDRCRWLLDELKRGAQLPMCRFGDDYVPLHLFDGSQARFTLISATDLIQSRAEYRARTGDLSGAVGDIQVIRRMSKHFADDPRNNMPIFHYWFEGWSRHAIQCLLNESPNLKCESILALIEEPLNMRDVAKNAAIWTEAEVKWTLGRFYAGRSIQPVGDDSTDFFQTSLGRAVGLPLLRLRSGRDDILFAKTFVSKLHENAEGFGRVSDGWRELEKLGDRGAVNQVVASHTYLQFSLGQLVDEIRESSNVAVAAAAFQLENGRYPQSTDELVPAYLTSRPTVEIQLDLRPNGLLVYGPHDAHIHHGTQRNNRVAFMRLRSSVFLGEAYHEYRRIVDR
jgi:hypothetical protein